MRTLFFATIAALALTALASPVAAHVHKAENSPHEQELANGQNHPFFVADTESGPFISCDGLAEPPDAGPAGYGLETAHHGADAGTPGKADGCYATDGAPEDDNPGIK